MNGVPLPAQSLSWGSGREAEPSMDCDSEAAETDHVRMEKKTSCSSQYAPLKNQNIWVARRVILLVITVFTFKEVNLTGGVCKSMYIYNIPLYYV